MVKRGRRLRIRALAEAALCATLVLAWNPSDASTFGTQVVQAPGKTLLAQADVATKCRLEAQFLRAYSSHRQTIRAQCGQQALAVAIAAHLGNVQVGTQQYPRPKRLTFACSACSPGQLSHSTRMAQYGSSPTGDSC